jgi:RHS repeat-associated protein
MLMPGRTFSSSSYRYGFNGKENDNDPKGIEGSQQDYGMRIYDPRVGRFLSVDPLIKQYPELTPYQFASNTPIQAIDLDGLEKFYYARSVNDKGETVLTPLRSEPLIESRQVLVAYSGGRSAMSDPQPVYKTVKEVNQRQEYIVYSPIERPITRAGNVTWETYQGVATFKTLEQAQNSKDADFQMQTGDMLLHYGVQGIINVGEEYKEGNAPGSKRLSEWEGPLDYSNLKEPRKVGPGLKTTTAQRQRILEYNKKMNAGLLRSDEDGSILDMPEAVPKGGKANMNQAEVDHKDERVKGGSNSNSNQRVVSKKQNLDKEAKRRKE